MRTAHCLLLVCILSAIRVENVAAFGLNRGAISTGRWQHVNSVSRCTATSTSTFRLRALQIDAAVNAAATLPPPQGPLETFIQDKFVVAVRAALAGDQSLLATLTAGTDAKSRWDNPFFATMAEAKEALKQFSGFFLDPSVYVFSVTPLGVDRAEVEYQLSFTYPLPWRPRVVIHAKAVVAVSSDLTRVVSVTEIWENSVFDLFRKQVLPRLWDIWHLFASPVPEFPQPKHLGQFGKVTFAEFPPAVVYEVRWSGLAKYPGPPLQTLPGFCFIGPLQTSKPNRDPFYTVLPVETNSDSFICPTTQREMKRTSWILPVPSQFQHLVAARAREGAVVTIPPSEVEFNDAAVDDEDPDTVDVKVNNLDNVNIMKSVTMGAQRGASLRFDEALVEEFVQSERTEYRYRVTPRRLFAQVDVKGEVTPAKISSALAEIRSVVRLQGQEILASRILTRNGAPATNLALKRRSMDTGRAENKDDNFTPQIGLLVSNCKACFNSQGELAMAIYEIQFGGKLTRLQVELDIM